MQRSLWTSINPGLPPAPVLSGNTDTDIAIVGAGIAGLSLALHLEWSGRDVIVLEADHELSHATAASAGVIAPQLVRTTPNSVLERLGVDAGGRMLRMLAEAGTYTFDLIRSRGLECSIQPYGFISPVSGSDGPERITALIDQWAPFRSDLRLSDAKETALLTGCQGYSAALVDSSGGALDPVAFAHALTSALDPSRVRVFRGSKVNSVARHGDRWVLRTGQGAVTAKTAVLCGNGGNRLLHPLLARTVLPLPVYEVATSSLPADSRKHILPQGHAMTDASADVFSLRFDRQGRLITACASNNELDYATLNQRINKRIMSMVPSYRETPLEYTWRGTAWVNTSLLPRLVRVDESLLAVQACNGRGIALNTIIGREVARLLSRPNGYQPMVPMDRPRPITGYTFARHVPSLLLAASALLKKLT